MKINLQELDWQTPLKQMSLGPHWRILVGVVLGAAISVAIWGLAFPHTFWFLKLWAGFATGSVLGTLAGTSWQIRDHARRTATSGRFLLLAILGWGAFALISLFELAPQMRAEEAMRKEIRAFTSQAIKSLEVNAQGRRIVADAASIKEFCQAANRAELFYPSHEVSTQEFEITIQLRIGNSTTYQARVPERHQGDLSLKFRGPSHWSEILLPGGRKWIEDVIR